MDVDSTLFLEHVLLVATGWTNIANTQNIFFPSGKECGKGALIPDLQDTIPDLHVSKIAPDGALLKHALRPSWCKKLYFRNYAVVIFFLNFLKSIHWGDLEIKH